ncbi:MAG: hypothetical protein HY055_06910, partial [Magnetospirillum sp.]|nr:hypothetical protein [Magnetospirillum sp.]
TLDGGSGNDTVDYSAMGTGVTVNLSTGTSGGAAANDHLVSIESIIGTNQADTLTAASGTLSLYGGGGDDVINITSGQLATFSGIIDGGGGTNTLNAAGGDLQAASAYITHVGAADVHNGSAGGAFALTAAAIQQIVGSGTSSDLTFTMDSGDTFTATTTAGVTVTPTVHDATYTHYDYIQGGLTIAQIEVHKV